MGSRPKARSRASRPAPGPGQRAGVAIPAPARNELLRIGRLLWERGLVGAAEGNLSVRLGPDRFLVTGSGVSKGHLSAADLVVVDWGGEKLAGARRPSTELRMHLAAYAVRPDVTAIVHAHPLDAVALTVAGVPPPSDLVPEAAVTLGPVAVAPFATPGTDEVPASLAGLLERHDVILLERHGAIALGRTLAEAYERMETLERVARIAVVARLLGRCEPLSPDAVDRVLAAAGRPPRAR